VKQDFTRKGASHLHRCLKAHEIIHQGTKNAELDSVVCFISLSTD